MMLKVDLITNIHGGQKYNIFLWFDDHFVYGIVEGNMIKHLKAYASLWSNMWSTNNRSNYEGPTTSMELIYLWS